MLKEFILFVSVVLSDKVLFFGFFSFLVLFVFLGFVGGESTNGDGSGFFDSALDFLSIIYYIYRKF